MLFRIPKHLRSYILVFAFALIGVGVACNNPPEPTPIPTAQVAVPTATEVALTQTPVPSTPTQTASPVSPTSIPTQVPPTSTATAIVPTPTVVAQELPSPIPVPPMPESTPVTNLSEAQAELDANRQKWDAAGIESYQFKYNNICFCIIDYVLPVTLEVDNGNIISATFVESGEAINEEDFERYKTIEELFDVIQEAIDRNAHRMTVSYDPELGYPTSGGIDYDFRLADEEFGFASDNLVEQESQGQAANASIDGHWEGAINVITGNLDIEVDFTTQPDGEVTATIDIPAQGVTDFPLSDINLNGSELSFEITEFGASFIGEVEGDTISGEFSQSGLTLALEINRSEVPETSETPAVETASYDEEEVTFQNGDIVLAGTLSLPPGDGPHPAIVLLTGSGAQDRDENLFGFKLFAEIADHLTNQGIAVLRYDDRGVDGSTGNLNDATLEDLAMDALAAVELLKNHPRIGSEQIGVLGHSEGGVTGPLAAVQSDSVAFVIMMAGPAATMEDILTAQSSLILGANGATEAEIQAQLAVQAMLFEAVRTDEGWDEVEAAIRQQIRAGIQTLPQEQQNAISNMDEFIENALQQQLQASQTPSFRYFLDYEPAPTLEQLDVPVLALFGGLDLQVPAEMNSKLLEQILQDSGHSDFTIETFPQANHLFQEAEKGSPVEYATLEKTFIPGFLDIISEWLLVRVDVANGS